MSTPPYPHFPEPFSTQDMKDDDPAVIDSLVQETNAPADPRFGVYPSIEAPQSGPAMPTRLFTVSIVLSGGAEPYPLLPEDIDRTTCRIRAISTGASPTYNDFALLGDNRGIVSTRMGNYLIPIHHNEPVDLDGHTGAVWVIPGPGMSAAIEVSAWGVTSYGK